MYALDWAYVKDRAFFFIFLSAVYGHRRELEPCLGIGIEADAAGSGIPATSISARFIPIPDWGVPLLRYRTGVPLFRYRTGVALCRYLTGVPLFRYRGLGYPLFRYRTEYANFTQRLRLVSYNEIFIRLLSTSLTEI